jgi:Bax protein
VNDLKFKNLLIIFVIFSSPIHADEFWGLEAWMNSERAPDFEKITDVKARKKAFFGYLLPEVQRQNSEIIELRNRIKDERMSDNKMTALKKYYKFKDDASIEDLLSSVDIVPTSLVLAQAAYESSWGRSRFAKYYHNYFGLWCFKKGCGVVPLRRDKKATHEVAKFASLSKGIAYYIRSINRNSAYETLRKIRKHKRDTQQPITGMGLAEGLENYAEIGYDYVETVQSIIKYNKLEQYDYQI